MIPQKNESIYPTPDFDGKVEFKSEDLRELEPTEVMIEVQYFGLNRADLMQVNGLYPAPSGAPNSLGLECSGTIIAKGEHVTMWNIGDPVAALVSGGAFAKYCICDERLCLDARDMDLKLAAAAPEVFISAYMALFVAGNLKPSSKILIHAGSSGVGLAATQLSKLVSCTVLTTCSRNKMQTSRQAGANIVIDYGSEDFAIKISEMTAGKGVDFILDFIGPDYWSKNIDSLALDGQLIILGILSGFQTKEPFYLGKIVMNRLTIKGTTLRSQSLNFRAKLITNFDEEYWPKVKSGVLQVPLDSEFDWKDIHIALDKMSKNLNQGKIICQVTD